MQSPSEPKPQTECESTHHFRFSLFLGWLTLSLSLYVLGMGPVIMMYDKGLLQNKALLAITDTFYRPLGYLYNNTFFHKPIGMYLHLWSRHFDAIGNTRP